VEECSVVEEAVEERLEVQRPALEPLRLLEPLVTQPPVEASA
jgi:hypothetical protein